MRVAEVVNDPSTETHRQGNNLDQVFARNFTFGEVNLSPGNSDEVSDHKCLNLTLKLQDLKSVTGY